MMFIRAAILLNNDDFLYAVNFQIPRKSIVNACIFGMENYKKSNIGYSNDVLEVHLEHNK